ncbi:MAG: NADPH-dependent FMN reductase [Bryobacteraceae bacterium]
MDQTRILAFAGSLRKDSYNKKLLSIAIAGATAAGADVTAIDLRDYPLPIYDGDLEAESGLPANALALKRLFIAAEGLLIASPEYNSSITAVFKNTIDWVSRPVPGEASLAAFDGKIVTLMAASPGVLGGLRGLVHVRAILGNINAIVLPGQVTVSKAHEAFTPEGQLKDARQQANVEKLGATLAATIAKLKG